MKSLCIYMKAMTAQIMSSSLLLCISSNARFGGLSGLLGRFPSDCGPCSFAVSLASRQNMSGQTRSTALAVRG